MPVDDTLKRVEEAVQPRAFVEGERIALQVGVARLVQQVVEQNAFLQRRQRIDVLDVGGAAGHAGDDGIDVGLLQPHQRQHGRRDGDAVGTDQVLGHGGRLARGGVRPVGQIGQIGQRRDARRVNTSRTSTRKPSWRRRSIMLTASSEWPPSSKKWSWRPTRSTPSSSLPDAGQRLLDLACAAPRTARAATAAPSGAGSALRSSLPLGVSGSASSATKAAGTM